MRRCPIRKRKPLHGMRSGPQRAFILPTTARTILHRPGAIGVVSTNSRTGWGPNQATDASEVFTLIRPGEAPTHRMT